MAGPSLPDRLNRIPVPTLLSVLGLGGFSILVLYSAAGGDISPWAINQGIRFAALLGMMLVLTQVSITLWLRSAYWFYGICLVLLIAVEIVGQMGGGSQRWLNLGVINLQPSELMKIAIVLALARYYHFLPRAQTGTLRALILPAILMGLPAALVMMQPDLGTALTIVMGGTTIVFLAGAPLWLFITGAVSAVVGIPLAVEFLLKEYQQKRVLIFLDPEADPLGAGYHITQSKIAIGSGGIGGKGFLSGTQSHLQYLPEQQTDFIFATMTEEWGLIGGFFVIGCYMVIIARGIFTALTAQSIFARLAAFGLTMTLFLYVFINLAMVMGFAPVVGIPLPLMSYGGSAMLTALLLLGILISIHAEKDRTTLEWRGKAL
ncbi:rod shape-determining protein RodA [Pacificimonas flava]|uniref:Peptidoglycan glycosyltransferase MrdB n=2 Tax=Pacificimonas TaxID=1960290 RepID=A0A219B5F5_9SPHN|nr:MULTISPECIES: rod shape-determining protein RodA [Pacificimonas]MBZ6379165.1 rod shape-determining protein RodA [Pacificimonas aurantium]OWV33610.1 rod shape-determining protein RodA [Pacificimonas flava]